jgi:hypothetical protein
MNKIEQLISGYFNPECDDWTATGTLLYYLDLLSDPFAPATPEYAQEVVQIWKPPWLKGIDWFD